MSVDTGDRKSSKYSVVSFEFPEKRRAEQRRGVRGPQARSACAPRGADKKNRSGPCDPLLATFAGTESHEL